MNTTITPSEKKLKHVIYGYPSCITAEVYRNKKEGDGSWDVVLTTKDPEYYCQQYDVLHNGERVTTIARLHGFGFGANAHYGYYTASQVEKLRSLLGFFIERSFTIEEINAM